MGFVDLFFFLNQLDKHSEIDWGYKSSFWKENKEATANVHENASLKG